jgi:mannose-6-phosphate isomerase-like protein (cupin superfamily)
MKGSNDMQHVIDISKIEGVRINEPFGRTVKIILAPDMQDLVKDITITMGIIDPHSRNDLHTHEGFELLYIVTGYGKGIVGDVTYEIKPDCLIIAPPGMDHCQFNESDDTMKMYCVWTPAISGQDVLDRALIAAGQK